MIAASARGTQIPMTLAARVISGAGGNPENPMRYDRVDAVVAPVGGVAVSEPQAETAASRIVSVRSCMQCSQLAELGDSLHYAKFVPGIHSDVEFHARSAPVTPSQSPTPS